MDGVRLLAILIALTALLFVYAQQHMPALLRSRLPQLRAWSNDAQDAAALGAMTAAQRIARQAVIEDRVAKMARLLMGLTWLAGQDDGA